VQLTQNREVRTSILLRFDPSTHIRRWCAAAARTALLWLLPLTPWFCFRLLVVDVVGETTTSSNGTSIQSSNKAYKICTVRGGLDVARLVSSNTRSLFRSAIEDVELIREYISEAAYNGGLAGGLSDLDGLAATLDWKARGLSSSETTLSAGLGYSDDRPDRHVERFVATAANEPFVGTKALDMALVDSASNIFPWIVDRRSVPSKWWVNHTNGRTLLFDDDAGFDAETEITDQENYFAQLYTAAWITTKGEATLYYPPLRVYGHPLTMADLMGGNYSTEDQEYVWPNLPQNNPKRFVWNQKNYFYVAANILLSLSSCPYQGVRTLPSRTPTRLFLASA
jgi:hypothetical protein